MRWLDNDSLVVRAQSREPWLREFDGEPCWLGH